MKKAKLILALVLVAAIALTTGIYATSSADSNPGEADNTNQNDVIAGNTPGSCGFLWDAERNGWHRPWDADSLIPASEKPEWQEFMPNEVVDDVVDSTDSIIGGTPGSCGFQWDAERNGWHRPWDADSFIPAIEKPEQDQFIPEPVGDMVIKLAPIHQVHVNIAESFPPQVMVNIQAGLSNGCTEFHGLTGARNGNTIRIQLTTQSPRQGVCTDIYGFFEKNENLGSDFISGEIYTIDVNGEITEFVMQ